LALRGVLGFGVNPLAALGEAFYRLHLAYPLVSLDISGQRPVSRADASPNEAFYFNFDFTPLFDQMSISKITFDKDL
jgi:hypothetical protein